MNDAPEIPHVLILGGGYVGLYTAWGLQKKRASTPMRITVAEPNTYMTYQPLLPEVAGGEVDPRNVTVQLRSALPTAELVFGRLQSLVSATKTAVIQSESGSLTTLHYDHVVFALGAITRTFPTPGLEETAIGFKTLEESLYLRNRVLEHIARAASTENRQLRRKALTFVLIGGGYTGVEAIAELSALAKIAIREYPNLGDADLHWVLVEAADAIATELGPKLSLWTLKHLRRQGIDVRLKTTMKSCIDGKVLLSDDDSFEADTIVWTAGMTPNPVLDSTDVPRGPKGHVNANARLQVIQEDGTVVDGAWAAGDNAQVPDLTASKQPAYYPPNAQNAVRQAKLLSQNLLADIRGDELVEYRHKSLGTLASYGVGQGAAVVLGVRLKGLPAWLVDRAYHGLAMPTFARKFRLFAGWLTELFTPRDLASIVATKHPRQAFVRAVEEARQQHEKNASNEGREHQ